MRKKLMPLFTGFCVIIIGLIITSGDFLHSIIGDYPALGIPIMVSGILLIIIIISYNKTIVRLIAILFPVLLVLTTVFNLTEDKVGWSLERKSSNSFFELSESAPKYQIYVYLQDNFTDWTLLASPEALELSTLLEWRLMEWGMLRSVQLEERNLTLTDDDFIELLNQPHILITYRNQDFIIDSSTITDNSDHTLVLLRNAGRNFLIPIDQYLTLESDTK